MTIARRPPRRSLRRLLVIGLLGTVAVGTGACGREDAATKAADARVIVALEDSPVPPTLHGLRVQEEDIEESLDGVKRPYLEATTLYSLRAGEALQATLQVGRFTGEPRYRSASFRRSLANRVGNGSANDVRMGRQQLWLTSGDRQAIAIWFRGDHVFILSSREEYTASRALLREALEITP